ncbi:AAA family ATPase [Desulfamplus magnetovallimortis]|nr:AAA family ATPase [Desulfamplus magnetovallimortis]
MNFPYGYSDFKKIILNHYFYCDRTSRIAILETNDIQLFLRPRRFGKSLLLSMLENYYDVAKKELFDKLFGHLEIGKKPTPLHNSYFILKWDFSCIDASGSVDQIRQSLYDHINNCIKRFLICYQNYNIPPINIDPANALSSIQSLANAVEFMDTSIYLLIDEYDNFANEVMMSGDRHIERYESLVRKEGILKTIFKNIKSLASSDVFDRIFITGVSPVVMSDITSGFNIGENIYFEDDYNDLCGFTESEIQAVLSKMKANEVHSNNALEIMKLYYNGYLFSQDVTEPVYNPTLVLYFLKRFQKSGRFPENMFDENLAMDISEIKGGNQLIIDLMQQSHQSHKIEIQQISQKFGIRRMLSDATHDRSFLISFLYYFGILTLDGRSENGDQVLKLPNLLTKRLYVDRINEMLLPEPVERDKGKDAAKKVYQKGDMEALCRFVEEYYFMVFRNRDYRWANELTVKTAFLTLLYNDILFIMDSEREIERQFADLTMIIRPDMRNFRLFDILIEFKYVSLADAGLTGEEARSLSASAIASRPSVMRAMEEGKEQARKYSKSLMKKYPELRLKSFVVTALGFDRVCWSEVVVPLSSHGEGGGMRE